MKNPGYLHPRRFQAAFTLIELIVVIAIIGILASLIFPLAASADKRKKISLAQTQLKDMEAAIDGYKTKLGFYPPDNPNNVITNQLYFELLGTTNTGLSTPTLWVTMDGSAQIDNGTAPNVNSYFGVSGFANTATRSHSDDSGAAAATFLNNLTPNQVGIIDPATRPLVKILVCSVTWPPDKTPAPIPTNPLLNPWRYNSSHPTNNTGTYDLWVDLVLRGKTNRVSNWNTQPIIL